MTRPGGDPPKDKYSREAPRDSPCDSSRETAERLGAARSRSPNRPVAPPLPGSPAGTLAAEPPVAAAATQTVVPERAKGIGRPAPPRSAQGGPGAAAAAPAAQGARPVRTRRARLSLRRLDPWSVFVMTLLLSLFLAIVTMVAAYVLYAVMDGLGIPASINKAVTDVQGGGAVLTRGRLLGGAALLAAVDVVLLTLLATLGALLYNLSASFTGGLEVTLAERD